MRLHGLLAEFDTPEALVHAAAQAHSAGYRKMDGYTPFPVEGLAEALGLRQTRLPAIVFLGGLVGGLGGFFMQYFLSVVQYPINVGGRPLNSWPLFIPVTFELTILLAALTGVVVMLGRNGLPMPYHPLFNVDRFALASRDRFFLCIEATDTQFDLDRTRQFLADFKPRSVAEVPL